MSWIELLDDNAFLVSLYGTAVPSLGAIRVHEVDLHQDGPSVTIRFDLDRYPATPPMKWQQAGYDTVQLQISGITITALRLDGWSANNVGRLDITRTPPHTEVTFRSPGCSLSMTALHLRVSKVTAYRSGP